MLDHYVTFGDEQIAVRLVGIPDAIASEVEWELGGAYAMRTTPPPAPIFCSIVFEMLDVSPIYARFADHTPAVLLQHKSNNPSETATLLVYEDGGDRWVAFPSGTIWAGISGEKRSITFLARATDDVGIQIRRLLTNSLYVPALESRGYLTLHAGLLASGDSSLLIAGPSGSGKTSVCLALLSERNDLAYGSCERAHARPSRIGVQALPCPEAVTVMKGTLVAITPLQHLASGADHSELWADSCKKRIPWRRLTEALHVSHLTTPMDVAGILYPHYDPALGDEIALTNLHDESSKRGALLGADVTGSDGVRAEWLGWFTPRGQEACIGHILDLPAWTLRWGSMSAITTNTSVLIDLMS